MNELIVVSVLVVLSILGIAWPNISGWLLKSKEGGQIDLASSPSDFEYRMRLINELLEACQKCEAEIKAVTAAGDVIAKHWKDLDHE
jgi:hypothetical protein